MSSYDLVRAAVSEIVQQRGDKHLVDYFGERPRRTYTGRLFERLGGGGDAPGVADRFTADDLLAVKALSVDVPIESSYEILTGRLGRELSDLLRQVPAAATIERDEGRRLLEPGQVPEQMWTLLEAQTGVGPVTAGKLLARKRPALIPVYDQVVKCVLGRPRRAWTLFAALLAGRELLADLDRVRAVTGQSAHISLLRTLDIVLWMDHREQHQRSCVRRVATHPR